MFAARQDCVSACTRILGAIVASQRRLSFSAIVYYFSLLPAQTSFYFFQFSSIQLGCDRSKWGWSLVLKAPSPCVLKHLHVTSRPDIGPTYVDSILSLWVMWWVELCSIFILSCHHPCVLCKCICTCRWTNHWKLWLCSGQAACVYHNVHVLPINTCTRGLPDCWAEPGNEARTGVVYKSSIGGFQGAWLYFRRARVGVWV